VFDNYSCNVMVDKVAVNLGLWDTAGQDVRIHLPTSTTLPDLLADLLSLFSRQQDYDRLRPLSYPQTDVFIVCFSVISETSFKNVQEKWLPEVKHYVPDAPVVIVGTKGDLRDDSAILERLRDRHLSPVPITAAQELARKAGGEYVEVSARTGQNVQHAFLTAVRMALFKQGLGAGGVKKIKRTHRGACSLL